MTHAIGIDLGGTAVKMVVVSGDGRLLDRFHADTDDSSGAWLANIRIGIHEMMDRFGITNRIGIAAPGLAAADGRSIRWMQGRLAAIQGLDWSVALDFGHEIPVVNDAHAALYGETCMGAARGRANVLMLTLGTGVGGAAMVDGVLLRGRLGRAGHVGHISLDPDGRPDIVGTPGSLEDAIGECTLGARSGGRFATTREMLEAIDLGDTSAQDIWIRAVRALAAGIVSLANVLDPELVILGGGVAAAGDALMAPLRQRLDEIEWRPLGDAIPIVGAELGGWSGAAGAAHWAIHRQHPAVKPGSRDQG